MKNTFTSFGMIASLAILVLPGCVSYAKYAQVADELARAQDDLVASQDELYAARSLLEDQDALAGVAPEEYDALVAQLQFEQEERARLAAQVDALRNSSGDLGSAIEVAYNREEGMIGYRAEGDVLFASGSSELTKAGREALDIVASKLSDIDAMVRVDGHTDSDPVVKTKSKYPEGNIQLGALRAISVRKHLIKSGLSASKVYIASYGPMKPAVAGTDADSKRRNRRVEIMVPVAALG